jgi:hypothetical protein
MPMSRLAGIIVLIILGVPFLALVARAMKGVPWKRLLSAAWDLACFERFIRRSGSPGEVGDLRSRHDRALLRAIGLGLVIALGGLAFSFRIPFALMFLLVIADLACLGLALRLLSR